MNASHDWLKAFVPHDLDAEALAEKLSRHVATVDGLHRLKAELAPFVVGQVMASEKIPDTKLSFNKVDDGTGELLEVVCGAPNVVVGTKYPFARTGTRMPAGLVIEKRKIRGFTSNGMLCSARELGLGEDHDGILPLTTDVPNGTPLLDVLKIGDTRIELDVLANRPDLLSQRGVAREVSAITGIPLQLPPELAVVPALAAPARDAKRASSGGATVVLEDPDGCPRYMAVVIRGVTVRPSPAWLVARLEGIGARSINNVVDVTNYMLHGFGQPMHAFDLKALAQSTIVVRRARAGEKMKTLDSVERALTPEMTVIADAERAVAIGGVMGGENSEVTPTTTDILLEVAQFEPRRVRATRKAVGLNTDASYRYERGIDAARLPEMVALATALLVQVAGGKVDGAPIDVGTPAAGLPDVTVRPSRVSRVIGVSLSAAEITVRLTSVGFGVTSDGPDALTIRVPSWRNDVLREIDLVEEVARLGGFDALPDELRPFRPGNAPDDPVHLLSLRVREALVGEGMYEAKPLPFVKGSPETHVRVENPLADDEPSLRQSVLESLAKCAEYNLNRGEGDVRLFEIGSAFALGATALPNEEVRVGALIMGARRPRHFTDSKPPAYDQWDAKHIAERIGSMTLGSGDLTLHASEGDTLWLVKRGEETVGRVARLTLDAPVWASPAYGIEITLHRFGRHLVAAKGANAWSHNPDADRSSAASAVRFKALPVTPPAQFDLALLVPDGTPAAAVEAVIRRDAGELLESVVLFDEFRGTGVPAGHRSLAWALTFRHPERTLRDKEVEGRRSKLLKTLEGELGVRPRAG
jgi:phenylalanyl-tRNA synthetase beta chain